MADRSTSRAGGAPISLGSGRRAAVTEPFEIDFRTVGEFYHKIETGFMRIPEHELFIGPRDAQVNARYVDLSGELVAVTDRASACSAIDMIIEQGEAPSATHPDAHFVVFDTIRMEYSREVESARARGEAFDPVRPVVSNPMTRFHERHFRRHGHHRPAHAQSGRAVQHLLRHDAPDAAAVPRPHRGDRTRARTPLTRDSAADGDRAATAR